MWWEGVIVERSALATDPAALPDAQHLAVLDGEHHLILMFLTLDTVLLFLTLDTALRRLVRHVLRLLAEHQLPSPPRQAWASAISYLALARNLNCRFLRRPPAPISFFR